MQAMAETLPIDVMQRYKEPLANSYLKDLSCKDRENEKEWFRASGLGLGWYPLSGGW